MSVKWGPFFDPSIPALVSYDVTAPGSLRGLECFDGTTSFDGNDVAVSGDLCLPPPVPAASFWGLVVLGMLLAAMGTLILHPPGSQRRQMTKPD